MLRSHVKRMVGVVFAGALLAASVGVTPAAAVSPWWRVALSARPAVLAPGGEGAIVAQAVNAGDSPTSGAVTLTDTLPAGVTAQSVAFYSSLFGAFDLTELVGVVSCETLPGSVRCEYPEFFPALAPYETLEMRVGVKVAANTASGAGNRIEVSGGGASAKSLARPLTLGAGGTPFGVDAVELVPEEEGGAVDARAGSHPFQLSGAISFNQTADTAKPPALVRDVQFKLPTGLVGNTKVIPQCSEQDFAVEGSSGGNLCPDDTVLGVAVVTIDEPTTLLLKSVAVPLFNLVPSRGEPARFGFDALHGQVAFDTTVRNGSDYGVTASVSNITQLVNPVSAQVMFWGVPGDPRHDSSRGWDCIAGGVAGEHPCVLQNQTSPVPLLTLPTSCTLPFVTSVEGRAWPTRSNPEGLVLVPGEYSLRDDLGREIGLTGCDQLPFAPSIHIVPDTSAASTPTGLTASVHIPQDASSNPTGLSEAALKDTTVMLPEGVQINPAAADGLESCSTTQVGFTGMQAGTNCSRRATGTCPDASKVGTVEIKSPLLPDPLTGWVYLAAQNANPFGSLIALYIVAEDPVAGVLVKLAGNVSLDPVTGRLTRRSTARRRPLSKTSSCTSSAGPVPPWRPLPCVGATRRRRRSRRGPQRPRCNPHPASRSPRGWRAARVRVPLGSPRR